MAAAAKLAIAAGPCGHPECAVPPAELLATFSGEDLYEAVVLREESPKYNGQVLARAILITQVRTRCRSVRALANHLQVTRSSFYRWARGCPISDTLLHRALLVLVYEP